MVKTLPNKHIRKAIYDLFNNTTVNGTVINVYDSRYTTNAANSNAYVLMGVQSNDVERNKCEDNWQSEILLEVCTIFRSTSNTGSRLLADDILDSLRSSLTTTLTLGGGLEVTEQTMTFPNDLTTVLRNGNLFRKFLRLELRIK